MVLEAHNEPLLKSQTIAKVESEGLKHADTFILYQSLVKTVRLLHKSGHFFRNIVEGITRIS